MPGDDLKTRLSAVSTATITSRLRKRSLQNCFLNDLKPLSAVTPRLPPTGM